MRIGLLATRERAFLTHALSTLRPMSFLTTPEGVRLRYTDRGEGEHTIVLVHGWKRSHRMCEHPPCTG